MIHGSSWRTPAVALLGALLAAAAPAQTEVRPARLVVENVRLSAEDVARYGLCLRDGRIEAILDAGAPTPPGARVLDGGGHLAVPAFIDAFTRTGCVLPEPVVDLDRPVDTLSDVRIDMRLANRKGIQPAFRVSDTLELPSEDGEKWRAEGFGALLSAPTGQLLAGVSVLVTTRDVARRDLILRPEVFAHGSFSALGRGGYPSTLMGYHAQLRQFFYDARHNAELHGRYAAGQPGPRPAWDPQLQAGLSLLDGERRLICNVSSSEDIERWLRLADEFGLRVGISNGRDAWEIADVLAVLEVPVIASLNWGKEVDDPTAEEDSEGEDAQQTPDEEIDWEYVEPLAVRAEKRREWEEIRDGTLVLHEAGVPFVFGTDRGSPDDLLANVRSLVANGLPSGVALDALTIRAAELLGVEQRLGRIEPGWDATFALWTGDPMDGESQLVWLFVDGFPHEFEVQEPGGEGEAPAEGLDASGTWSFEFQSEEGEGTRGEATLTMEEDGRVTGSMVLDAPFGDERLDVELAGRLSGATLELSGTIEIEDFSIEFELSLEVDGDRARGEASYTMGELGERTAAVKGRRAPGGSASERGRGGQL